MNKQAASSEAESQRENEKYIYRQRERKGVIKTKNSHWLSSLRGRLRQAHGPSSESQRHRPGEFGHSRQDSRLSRIQVSDSLSKLREVFKQLRRSRLSDLIRSIKSKLSRLPPALHVTV